MFIYRITKSSKRANDLSGMGAFKEGGRWNNQGTYMLYTSENSSLAYLESMVHFEAENAPPNLYIICLEIKVMDTLIHVLPDDKYPKNWQEIANLENKFLGDLLMQQRKFAAIKVRSAINKFEYNYLLNPLFPGYNDLIKIHSIEKITVDSRLVK